MHRPEATGLVPVLRHLQDWVVMGQALGGFPIGFQVRGCPRGHCHIAATYTPLFYHCITCRPLSITVTPSEVRGEEKLGGSTCQTGVPSGSGRQLQVDVGAAAGSSWLPEEPVSSWPGWWRLSCCRECPRGPGSTECPCTGMLQWPLHLTAPP